MIFLGTSFCVQNKQVFGLYRTNYKNISYIEIIFKVLFMQVFVLFRVRYRQVILYIDQLISKKRVSKDKYTILLPVHKLHDINIKYFFMSLYLKSSLKLSTISSRKDWFSQTITTFQYIRHYRINIYFPFDHKNNSIW